MLPQCLPPRDERHHGRYNQRWMDESQNRLRELIVRVGFQFRIVSAGNADQSGIETRVS
jgi:hypothetical protein